MPKRLAVAGLLLACVACGGSGEITQANLPTAAPTLTPPAPIVVTGPTILAPAAPSGCGKYVPCPTPMPPVQCCGKYCPCPTPAPPKCDPADPTCS